MPFTASMAIGGAQALIGGIQAGIGQSRLKRLAQKRTAYQTPQEIIDANSMAMQQAQTGFGAETSKYLTTKNDRALSASLGSLERLGGDPNDVAAVFDANVTNIMKTAADNETLQMQKFNRLYSTMTDVAKGKEAEWQSREMMIKDEMAAAAQKVQAGTQNIQSGANMVLGGFANRQQADLFKEANQIGEYAPTANSTTSNSTGSNTGSMLSDSMKAVFPVSGTAKMSTTQDQMNVQAAIAFLRKQGIL
jgi:hypothetical protein